MIFFGGGGLGRGSLGRERMIVGMGCRACFKLQILRVKWHWE